MYSLINYYVAHQTEKKRRNLVLFGFLRLAFSGNFHHILNLKEGQKHYFKVWPVSTRAKAKVVSKEISAVEVLDARGRLAGRGGVSFSITRERL